MHPLPVNDDEPFYCLVVNLLRIVRSDCLFVRFESSDSDVCDEGAFDCFVLFFPRYDIVRFTFVQIF